MFFGRFGESEFGRPGRSFFRALKGHCYEDKPGGGGGGGTPDAKDVEIADLKAKLEAATKPKPDPAKPDPKPDPDLQDKARLEREAREKSSNRDKDLERAIKFDMESENFVKQNEALLPKDAADILAAAKKEKYSDAIAKDRSVKAALVQSFFKVQANVDMLTGGQKAALDDYLALTKDGKEEKAQQIYDMVFEPAFNTLKQQKKAEALSRGHGTGSDVQDAYKKRLIAGSKKHYLGEKTDA